MRKWIIAGSVVLVLCVVFIVVLLNLNALINRNKDYLLEQAQQALGRRVSVGDVGVSLWGGLGVRLNNFAMADDPAFSPGEFVRARDLQLNVRLLPLLRRNLEVKRVILHQPVIQVIRDKQGRFNFSTIGAVREKKPREKIEKEERPPEEKLPPALLVSLVDISGGEVHYLDRATGADIRARQIDFRVRDLDRDRPFDAQLATALFADKQNVKLNARIGPLGHEFDLGKIPLDGTITVDPLDFTQLQTALPTIKAALPKDVNLAGIVRIRDLQLRGNLNDVTVKGNVDGTAAAVNYGKTLHKPSGTPLVLTTDARYANQAMRFGDTKLQFHNMQSTVKGDLALKDAPVANLTVSTNRFSLDGWDKLVPALQGYALSGELEANATVKGKIGQGAVPQIQGMVNLARVSAKPPQFPQPIRDLDTTIVFTGKRADIKDMTLSLGASKISLAAEIDQFAPFTLSYKISTPELRPADFQSGLPAERKADVIRDLSSAGSLRTKNGSVTFQGNLSSANGRLYQIDYKSLSTQVTLENQVANLRNLRLNALSGSMQVDGTYSYAQPQPQFSVSSNLQGINLSELYRSLDPKAAHDIEGRLNANMKVAGNGNQWQEIKPTLRGQGNAEVLDGALLNVNIAERVLTSATGIPGLTALISPEIREKYPETFQAKDTRFKVMKGLFNIAEARFNVKDLQIAAADYGLQGNGWVDFDKQVDFQARLTLSQRLSADLARSVREITYLLNPQNQFELPFALTGILPNVKPRPDTGYVSKMIERGLVRRGAEELQRRFFGKKETPPATEPGVQPPAEEKTRPEDLIRKGLEQLFRR